MDFGRIPQIFMIREPNSSKITKLKTLLASWFRSKCSKKFKKLKNVKIVWWFSRPLSKEIRYISLFEKRLLTGNKWHEIQKSSWFFVRRPCIFIRGNMKNTFLCFFDSNAILLWKNIEKSSKFNKKYEMHPNWRQNRLMKISENRRKTFKIDDCVEFPL